MNLLICFSECSRVILLGDLNYRVSLPEATTRLLVERKDWETLLQNDQVILTILIDKLAK